MRLEANLAELGGQRRIGTTVWGTRSEPAPAGKANPALQLANPTAAEAMLAAGFSELRDTFKELFKLKGTLHFLIAYLLYNDGIQTVITMASVFLSQELFVSRGLEIDRLVLFGSFFIAQIFGFFGALLFERIAHFTSAKTAILVSLVIWCGIVFYGSALGGAIGTDARHGQQRRREIDVARQRLALLAALGVGMDDVEGQVVGLGVGERPLAAQAVFKAATAQEIAFEEAV